jgi:hypothetical protein
MDRFLPHRFISARLNGPSPQPVNLPTAAAEIIFLSSDQRATPGRHAGFARLA